MEVTTHLLSNGKSISIEQPTPSDAAELIRHSKAVFESTDQLLTLPEEYTISVQDEEKWIDQINNNPNAWLRVAKFNGQIIAMLFFLPSNKRKASHTGEFGINVHPQFQKMGVGRLLVQALLNWAQEHSTIEKVSLNVFATNTHAIELYRSLGFIEEGRFHRAIKQPGGGYVDVLQMSIILS